MTNRREFLQIAAASAAMGALPAYAGTPSSLPLYKVVYDARYAPAVSFAAEARRFGANVARFRGNVTNIWYDDLYHRWKTSPDAIAGLTSHDAWFVLDMMARDAGLRTVYRAHHVSQANGAVEHKAFGPHALVRDPKPFDMGQEEWSRAAARLVMNFPMKHVAVEAARSDIARARSYDLAYDTLVSWVIAPVVRS